jgi:hypothetical protein
MRNAGIILAGALLASGCTKSAEAEGRRHHEDAGDFSFIPPEGWVVQEMPGLKYSIAHGQPQGGFTSNLNVIDQAFPGSLESYVDGNLQGLERIMNGFSMSSREQFTTDEGKKGIRLVTESIFNGTGLEQHFYFFDTGKKMVVITCSRLAGSEPRLDAAFDACVKTFRFE